MLLEPNRIEDSSCLKVEGYYKEVQTKEMIILQYETKTI